MNMQRLVIDRALESGKRHLENHDSLHPATPSRAHLAENLRNQLSVIRDRWPTLVKNSDAWQKILDEALRVSNLECYIVASPSQLTALACERFLIYVEIALMKHCENISAAQPA